MYAGMDNQRFQRPNPLITLTGDLRALMQHLGIEQHASLLGFSLGGTVALLSERYQMRGSVNEA